MKVCIELTDGSKMNFELYPDIAPISVENFLSLVDEGYYDGLIFHRIIANFMVQTGGYYLENNTLMEKAKVPNIKGEFALNGVQNDLKHEIGVLSMARAVAYDSGSSQFFICTGTSPHLDGSYAAFGKILDKESLTTLMSLNSADTYALSPAFANFPYNPPTIKTISRI